MPIASLKESLRHWCRKNLLTINTIRYRVEYARISEAFRHIGPQQRVFDGGAGGGQMLRMVYEDGYCKSAAALEYDPELFDILIRNHAGLSNFEAVQGSLLDIPFPDASMDCAMTTQVLEHIEDHQTAASELGRIVKPGGHLIISVPHPPEPFHTPGHVREGYTEADLTDLFPPPRYELLLTGYSLTRPTIDRVMKARSLPLRGRYMPVAWADMETHLTNDERKAQLPYAITCLFRKNP
jgi:SAM-dependent methyltransferase